MFGMEIANMIVYAVMAVSVIGVLWAWKGSTTNPNLKPLIFVFVAVILGCLVMNMFVFKASKSEDKRFDRNLVRIQTAKAARAAEYIDEKWHDGKIIFLASEDIMNESEDDYTRLFVMREIMRRLDAVGISYEENPVISKPEAPKKVDGVMVQGAPNDLTSLTKALRPYVGDKVDVCVNFVGLPEVDGDADKLTYITKKSAAKKGNMLVMVETGLPYLDRKYIESGRVAYVFEDSHGNDFDLLKQEAPKDLSATFDQFYSLVDSSTLNGFISDNPDYFPKKEEEEK